MYHLKLNEKELAEFRAEAKTKMVCYGLSYQELADRCGYSVQSLYNFFSGSQKSKFLAYALAKELKIEGYANED